MIKSCYKHLKKEVSFLILDFNRPDESELLLNSIKKHVKFDNYEVIFYSNGGEQDYVLDFYKKGLIDRLILNKKNDGVGLAEPRLTEFCQTEFFINVQCDRYLSRDFSLKELNEMKGAFIKNPDLGAIDFTFNKGFSENAFMMNTEFYCKNDLHLGGGPGPYNYLGPGSETSTFDWIINNSLKVVTWPNQLFSDSGKYSIQETRFGGIIKKRCDSQQVWLIQKPTQKENIPGILFNDEEWKLVLAGKWRGGTVPENAKPWIFSFFSDEPDPLDPIPV